MANTKVTTGVIKDDAVGADQLASNAVVTASIADNAITTAKISDDAILTAKISNSAITNAKMSANSVDSDQYVDGSIDTAHIADSQITSAKLDTNIAVGGTLTLGSHLIMGDNDRIKIGAGTDLQIYHDGSASIITDVGTGDLRLLGNNLKLGKSDNSATYLYATEDGSVELYYAGSKKLETTSSGVTVTGTLAATLSTAAQPNITSVGTLSALTVDNFTLNGTTLALSSGEMTIDVADNIKLDSGSGEIRFFDGGTYFGKIIENSGNLQLISGQQDKDILFVGNDNGTAIIALTLDMSDAGSASFNHDIQMVDNGLLRMGAGGDLIAFSDGTNALINANNGNLTLDAATDIIFDADSGVWRFKDNGTTLLQFAKDGATMKIYSAVSDADIMFQGNDGGSTVNALTLDMSDAGSAIFNGNVTIDGFTNEKYLTLRSGFAPEASGGVGLRAANHAASNRDGLAIYGHDGVSILTAQTERMRVNATGVVSIGNAENTGYSDDYLVQVGTDGSGSNSFGMLIRANQSGISKLGFADGADADGTGKVWYDHSSNYMRFDTAGSEKMRLDSSGSLVLQDGTTYTSNAPTHRGSLILAGPSGATSYGGIEFHPNAGGGAGYGSKIGASDAEMTFSTRNNSATFTQRMVIKGDGQLLFGKTSTSDAVAGLKIFEFGGMVQGVDGTGNVDMHDFYRGTAGSLQRVGNIRTNGSSTAYNTSSDYRLKENVDYTWDATTRLKQLKPARFNFIVDADNTVDGFLAHEVQDIVPEAITGEKDGETMQGMDYGRITPLLVKAIQEQQTLIESLTARIETLEG